MNFIFIGKYIRDGIYYNLWRWKYLAGMVEIIY